MNTENNKQEASPLDWRPRVHEAIKTDNTILVYNL